jgi:integrase
MPKRKGLTDKQIAVLPRKPKRYIIADPEQRGLYLRIPPEGPIAFTVIARGPGGRQIWVTIGTTAETTADQARSKAREALSRIKAGKPAVEPPKPAPDTVTVVAQNWLHRVVEKNAHRTADETRRIVKRYILPHIGARVFTELKRSEITAWLDEIEDQHGTRMAGRTMSVLRAIANWVQSRGDDYVSPFTRKMGRHGNRARERILDDAEIRHFWRATENSGSTGACLRLLLLTAQRRTKVLEMRWQDVSLDGVWTIATEAREKSTAGMLKLPEAALSLIKSQPRHAGSDRVFWFRETTLDDAKAAIGGDWTIHDLRRTARSLMSRAGVLSEHAERVLGHAIGGVEGVYDRHRYDDQKADALRKLAALIERIASPPADNVVALGGGSRLG